MDKLKMSSGNIVNENIDFIASRFPNVIVEIKDENGKIVKAVDFDILKQELSSIVVDGDKERYTMTWPDKKQAILTANAPIAKTLRPCVEESVGKDGTNGVFDSENLYIEGDNLDVLKLLRETYLGQIKMIYIDPPYNTGNDFVYNDDFATDTEDYLIRSNQVDEEGNRMVANNDSNGRFHTDWLNMIYPRLRIAKDLLSNDGVIFISIDDNELDNLKKLCDEIFGGNNFISYIIHKNNSMKNQSKYIGVSTEYVLVYSKNIVYLDEKQGAWRTKKKGAADINATFAKLKAQGLSLTEIREEIMEMYSRPKYAHLSRWNKVDEQGVFKDADLSRSNGPKDYTIINPETGKPCPIPNRGWGKSYEELLRLQKEGLIWYGDGTSAPGMKSYLTEDSESVFDNFVFADTAGDKKLIDKMFGAQVFEFPKSLDMIKQFIALCASQEDIILDFFSGSATTAHAIMQLNAEDGGNRKFIMVQLPEITDEKSEAYKAGYKNICEIGKEGIRRAGKQLIDNRKNYQKDFFGSFSKDLEEKGLFGAINDIKAKKDNGELDIGFRVLKLDSSCMKDVYYNPADIKQDLLAGLEDNIKEDRTAEDLLFQVMLDMGVLLSSEIKVLDIKGKKVFNVNDGNLICCFDKNLTEEVVTEIAQLKPLYAVFRDSSFVSDSIAVNFDQIFETYSPTTTRKII